MRKFEKISFDEFKKTIKDDMSFYKEFRMPSRSTKNSAGYDIYSIQKEIIHPGESAVFKTGLKVCMNSDEVLMLYSRSSQGYKHEVCLTNSVGVIDSDFYNNKDNEGHFSVKLSNNGKQDYIVNIGDKIAQGVFVKYLTVDDEEEVNNERSGGLGSTGK